MSQVIPLEPAPSQTLGITLGDQPCTIAVAQRGETLLLSLRANDVQILTNKACRTDMRLLLATRYLGFRGDLVFVDTESAGMQPSYEGLGSRWVLLYLTEDELP